MRFSLRRWTAPFVFCTLVGSLTPPAHAEQAWVEIGRGEVVRPADPGVGDLVLNLLRSAGGVGCAPKKSALTAYNLGWSAWSSADQRQIAYVWRGPGSAMVSDECASRVNVTVQVSDYAPGGRPPVERGNVATGSAAAGSTAYAQSEAWVTYYDVDRIYVRGNSLVEIKVSGSYYNTKAKATLPLGCIATYTPVTPTPLGPQFGETTGSEPCQ